MGEKSHNPYPGLRPYHGEESGVFYGRESETRELLNRLSHFRFLAVVGASGCGKSSLVRAGLIPALEAGFDCADREGWKIAKMRPGAEPIKSLATGLWKTVDDDTELKFYQLDRELSVGSMGIVRFAEKANWKKGTKLFLLVDQFEELFTMRPNPDEAADFVQILLDSAWSSDFPIHIVITLRSDENLGKCARFAGLPVAINNGLFLVPRMDRTQLEDAISEPVRGNLTNALLVRLLNDLKDRDPARTVGDDRDELPLLQHALMRIWEAWQEEGSEGPLDIVHYERIGEIGHALSMHIEEEVLASMSPQDRQLAESLFLEIVRVGDGGEMNRSPRAFEDLLNRLDCNRKALERVINVFRGEGRSFLLPPIEEEEQLRDESMIDISHESLIRQWDSLCKTARERCRELEDLEMIRENAAYWERHGREDSDLNLAVEQLGHFENLAARHASELQDTDTEFLRLNVAKANEEEDRERKRRTRVRTSAVLGLILIIAAGAAYWVLMTKLSARDSEVKRVEAEKTAIEESANAQRSAAEAARLALAKTKAEKEAAEAKTVVAEAEKEAADSREKATRADLKAAQALADERLADIQNERNERLRIEAQNQLFELQMKNLAAQLKEYEDEGKTVEAEQIRQSQLESAFLSFISNRSSSRFDDQTKHFDETVVFAGIEGSRSDVGAFLTKNVQAWPKYRWHLIGEPEFKIASDRATVSAILHFDFEGRQRDRLVGMVRETSRWSLESDQPLLKSLTVEPLDPQTALGVLQNERNRLKELHNQQSAEPKPSQSKLYELSRRMGEVLFYLFEVAGNSEVTSLDRSDIFDDTVDYFEDGLIDQSAIKTKIAEFDINWPTRRFSPLAAPLVRDSTRDQNRFWVSGNVLVELKSRRSEMVEVRTTRLGFRIDEDGNALIDSVSSEDEPTSPKGIATWGDPWDLSEAMKIKLRIDSLVGRENLTKEEERELVEEFSRLYLLCGNPDPVIPQVNFFAETSVNYYGKTNWAHSDIEGQVSAYEREFPNRHFDSIRIERSDSLSGGNNSWDVRLDFDVQHEPSSRASERTIEMVVKLEDGEWPQIISVIPR